MEMKYRIYNILSKDELMAIYKQLEQEIIIVKKVISSKDDIKARVNPQLNNETNEIHIQE